MAATRFNNDTARLDKRVNESVGPFSYQLNTPGNGLNVPFMADPHIRIQKWGANLRNNTTNLESDLRGITRKLSEKNVLYDAKTPHTTVPNYRTEKEFVDETRASNPAWVLRDLETKRWFEEERAQLPELAPCVSRTKTPVDTPFDANVSVRFTQKWGTYGSPYPLPSSR